MFPQPVTFQTRVAVTVFLHITDVAEVVFMQIQIHCIFKAVGDPVEATTIVQNFVLLLVENVV
jgi:hypothetical protein